MTQPTRRAVLACCRDGSRRRARSQRGGDAMRPSRWRSAPSPHRSTRSTTRSRRTTRSHSTSSSRWWIATRRRGWCPRSPNPGAWCSDNTWEFTPASRRHLPQRRAFHRARRHLHAGTHPEDGEQSWFLRRLHPRHQGKPRWWTTIPFAFAPMACIRCCPTDLSQIVILWHGIGDESQTGDFNSGRAVIGTGPFRLRSLSPWRARGDGAQSYLLGQRSLPGRG